MRALSTLNLLLLLKLIVYSLELGHLHLECVNLRLKAMDLFLSIVEILFKHVGFRLKSDVLDGQLLFDLCEQGLVLFDRHLLLLGLLA